MGLLEVVVFAWVLLTLLVWGGVVLCAPTRFLAQTSPRARAFRARLWLYAPLWLPLMLVGAAILPGLLGGLMGWGDHCTTHEGHHHHLCVLHPPHLSSNPPLVWAMLLASGLPIVFKLGRTSWSGLQHARLVHTLIMSSRPCLLGEDVRLLEDRAPIALTTGLFRPVEGVWQERT